MNQKCVHGATRTHNPALKKQKLYEGGTLPVKLHARDFIVLIYHFPPTSMCIKRIYFYGHEF